MTLHDPSSPEGPPSRISPRLRMGLALAGFLVIAGALLLTEHRAHVLGALIYVPLLLCPLLHVFMHGGHGKHGGHGGGAPGEKD